MELNLKLKEQLVSLEVGQLSFEVLAEIQNEFLKNNDIDDMQIEVFKVDSKEFKEVMSNMVYEETFSYFLEEIKDFDNSSPFITFANGMENVNLEYMRDTLLKELNDIIEDQSKDYIDEHTR